MAKRTHRQHKMFGEEHYNRETDGRKPGEWESKYPNEAKNKIRMEALVLSVGLLFFSVFLVLILGSEKNIFHDFGIALDRELTAIFFVGCIGGMAYSIKWLMHSVAHGLWHCDRRVWRYFSPVLGGVYTLAVFHIGFFAWANTDTINMETYGVAFLIGYFGDGISGALTNVARAILGTVNGKT